MNKIHILIFFIVFKIQAQTSVLNSADSLFAVGNYSKAITLYKSYNNQEDIYYKMAKSYEALGSYDDALNYYKLSVNVNPDDALIKYNYAKLLAATKKYNEASAVFKKLIEKDSTNPNFHYELGLVLEKQKNNNAINEYYKTYKLDTIHQKSLYKIAKHHLEKREHHLVTIFVDKGLKFYANNLKLISLKAQNYFWQQDYRNAIIWFEKLIELGEESEYIVEKLSLCYAKHFMYPEALKYSLQLLKYNPKNAEIKYSIGTYYLELKDYTNAEMYMQDALLLLDKPLDREYLKLATALNHQNKYTESIEVLKKAINENPTNEYAHFQLAITLENYYKDIDEKIRVYQNLKEKFPEGDLVTYVEQKISKLKQEKFVNEGEKKD
ncbi:tetratricopeptide repeat protein [Neotamlana laminarinivorans]|uniref:Tetratricopeptide repeat protein n=1 Tax=Neotamlana laminarinivorans TaxID=2883124 RepID=A0A9X1I4D0_9FLAO|nr:tetratricopeptide repeat protein [Tamlana laminarinivorans]MCB4799764.1 tetratricopeptide repeat protein [Tamlana laminarinivorans]